MMSDKEKLLLRAFRDVIWMAVRYAHGRRTVAPGIVRDAIRDVRRAYPDDFKLERDRCIEPLPAQAGRLPEDSLHDIYQ